MGVSAVDFDPGQQKVVDYIRNHVKEWVVDPYRERELEIRARIAKAEETVAEARKISARAEDQSAKNDVRIARNQEAIIQLDKRLEEGFRNAREERQLIERQMDKRFDAMEKRFDSINIRFNWVYGMISGLMLTVIGGFVTVMIRLSI